MVEKVPKLLTRKLDFKTWNAKCTSALVAEKVDWFWQNMGLKPWNIQMMQSWVAKKCPHLWPQTRILMSKGPNLRSRVRKKRVSDFCDDKHRFYVLKGKHRVCVGVKKVSKFEPFYYWGVKLQSCFYSNGANIFVFVSKNVKIPPELVAANVSNSTFTMDLNS